MDKVETFLLGLIVGILVFLLVVPIHVFVYNSPVQPQHQAFLSKFEASLKPNGSAWIGHFEYNFTTWNTSDVRNKSIWHWGFLFLIGKDTWGGRWLWASTLGNNSTAYAFDELPHAVPMPKDNLSYEGTWFYFSEWYMLWNGTTVWIQEPWMVDAVQP